MSLTSMPCRVAHFSSRSEKKKEEVIVPMFGPALVIGFWLLVGIMATSYAGVGAGLVFFVMAGITVLAWVYHVTTEMQHGRNP